MTHVDGPPYPSAVAASAEMYGESFGVPSSILDIAMWDHDMLLMWADAVSLSDISMRRLDAASELAGKDLVEPKEAEAILESILDEGDLQTALAELEALRVLMHLQPGTRVLHHVSPPPTTESNVNGGGSDEPSLMTFAAAEAWLAKLHGEMQQLHATAEGNTTAASGGILCVEPSHCSTADVAAALVCSNAVPWGEDWELSHAPPIVVVGASAAVPDAMGSDLDDEDNDLSGHGSGIAAGSQPQPDASGAERVPANGDDGIAPPSSNGSFSSVDLAANAAVVPRRAYCVDPLGRKWHHPDDDEFL